MSHLVVLVFGYRAPVDIQVLLPDSACAHRLHCSQETWFVRMLFAIWYNSSSEVMKYDYESIKMLDKNLYIFIFIIVTTTTTVIC